LAQNAAKVPAAVVCVYGEEMAIRESTTNLAMGPSSALIIAAIAIPNLLRSRIAANEASAVGSLRSVNTAQVTYASTYSTKGFAPNLATLGTDPRAPGVPSPEHADLLDVILANDSCTGEAWCTKSGYRFRVSAVCKQGKCEEYVVVATPVTPGTTGMRSFCSTSDGVIRTKSDALPDTALSASGCKAWSPI
jgi:type II secretory pathway pseudopilin PulG